MSKANRRCFGYVTNKGKAVRQSVLEQYAIKQDEVGSRVLGDEFEAFYGELGLLQPVYNPRSLSNLTELNTYHSRCIATKARDIAGLGYMLTAKTVDASETQGNEVRAFLDGLTEPLTETLYRAQHDYEATGFAAIEIVRENYEQDGKPIDLHHIPSIQIRHHKDERRALQTRGTKKRWFKIAGTDGDVDYETGKTYPAGELPTERRASEIIWYNSYSPRSEYYGIPEWVSVIGTISGDYSRREYNRTFFDNYGVPAYAVFITGNFDPGTPDANGRTELEAAIEEHFDEVAKNPHSTLILTLPTMGNDGDVKVEFKPLATDIKEASFRMYRADNRDEVMTAHGVPPYRVGVMVSGSLAGNMSEEATEIYKMSIIEPRQRQIEAWFNRVIVRDGFDVSDWKFELAEIDQKNEDHELDIQLKLHEIGAMTATEIRDRWADKLALPGEIPQQEGAPRFAVVGAPALVAGGVMTLNEARAAMGLAPVAGGDTLRDPDLDGLNVVERSLNNLRGELNAALKD